MSPTREERLEKLLKKARSLTDVPGVYLMKDAEGTVVYVGKASRLPDRVSSYFVPSADLGLKKDPMLDVVDDFDVIECEGEWEALLMESRLIKDLKPPPRYNVRLKDGKSFPYLAITQREPYPRVFVTRNPTDPAIAGAKLFGPFTNTGALREAVQMLQRVFRFRTCDLEIDPGDERNRFFRPCILHAIDQCTAPCASKITVENYKADVDRFVRFLGSKRSAMVRELNAEMEAAATEMRFERAAVLRDQIRTLEKLDQRASIDDGYQPETEVASVDPEKGGKSLQKLLGLDAPVRCIEGFDIAHLMGGETVGSKVCFIDGRPFKEAYRRFKVRTVTNNDFDAMREVVSRRYRDAGEGHELYPDLVLIDGGPGQLGAAMDALGQLDRKPPLVVSLAKKEELVYLHGRPEPFELSRSHTGLKLLQAVRDEAHRFAQAYHHILRRKKTIGE
ncbi:MAG TPA: excinuclease ABC subunit UvrC [Phycisphaerales bacterium]|nr:excinuclease ABC subunit UvrC [Phycisphaerales bacterium]